MLCKCQIPAKDVRANPPFFTCGYYPQRCKMFASRPLIPNYGGALTNLSSATRDRFVAFELALHPKTGEESFYVKPLDVNDPVLKTLLNDVDRWPEVLFSTKRKQWLFPIKNYREVADAVKPLGYAVYEVPVYIFDFVKRVNDRSAQLKVDLYAEEERRKQKLGGGDGVEGNTRGGLTTDESVKSEEGMSAAAVVKEEKGSGSAGVGVAAGGFVSTAGYTVPDWAKGGAVSPGGGCVGSRLTPPHPTIPTESDPLYRQLKPFQKEGVRYVLEHGGRAMIADEMGLGKTVQAICSANCYNEEWPVLVMCPGSLCDNWAKEFNKWLLIPNSRIHIVRAASQMKKKDARLDLGLASVVIVGYQNLKHLPIGFIFKVVILDECHFIKNPHSQRTKEAQIICNNANRTILLSGTPAMSRPYELLPQLQLIAGISVDNTKHGNAARFLGEFQYSNRYCGGFFTNATRYGGSQRPNHSGHSNTDELRMLLQNFIIRRCKKDVLGEMPSKTRKCLYLRVTEKELRSLENSMNALKKEVSKAGGAESFFRGAATMSFGSGGGGGSLPSTNNGATLQLKVQTAKAKVPAVKDYLKEVYEELIESNEEIAAENAEAQCPEEKIKPKKIIVFAHHLELLSAAVSVAESVLGKKGYEFIRVSGETSMHDREGLCNRFRENPKCAAAVLSMQAMGTGHNLTCASKVIFTELDWNPSTHLQCEDRVHRIGQEDECVIQYLLADGTADEVVWPLLQQKLDVTLSMIAGSTNDAVVLGGGAGLQDKEVVQRKDTVVTGGVCGGSATLDAWVVRKEITPSSTDDDHTYPYRAVERHVSSSVPVAPHGSLLQGNHTNTSSSGSTSGTNAGGGDVHTAVLRAGSVDLVRPVPSGGLPKQTNSLIHQRQQWAYNRQPTSVSSHHSQTDSQGDSSHKDGGSAVVSRNMPSIPPLSSSAGSYSPMASLSQALDAALGLSGGGVGVTPHSVLSAATTPSPSVSASPIPAQAPSRRTLLSFSSSGKGTASSGVPVVAPASLLSANPPQSNANNNNINTIGAPSSAVQTVGGNLTNSHSDAPPYSVHDTLRAYAPTGNVAMSSTNTNNNTNFNGASSSGFGPLGTDNNHNHHTVVAAPASSGINFTLAPLPAAPYSSSSSYHGGGRGGEFTNATNVPSLGVLSFNTNAAAPNPSNALHLVNVQQTTVPPSLHQHVGSGGTGVSDHYSPITTSNDFISSSRERAANLPTSAICFDSRISSYSQYPSSCTSAPVTSTTATAIASAGAAAGGDYRTGVTLRPTNVMIVDGGGVGRVSSVAAPSLSAAGTTTTGSADASYGYAHNGYNDAYSPRPTVLTVPTSAANTTGGSVNLSAPQQPHLTAARRTLVNFSPSPPPPPREPHMDVGGAHGSTVPPSAFRERFGGAVAPKRTLLFARNATLSTNNANVAAAATAGATSGAGPLATLGGKRPREE